MSKKIDQYKELLEVLPRTNVKNSRDYRKKALVMKQEIQNDRDAVLREIKKRYSKIVIEKDDNDIDKLKDQLVDVERNIQFLNIYNDSYEKTGLSEILYDLSKFYENDLLKVNNDIQMALDEFKTVGVELTAEDFTYGNEVESYMKEFFKEKDIDSPKIHEAFDKLYWKSPNLFEYINLCLRHLYTDNQKSFETYCSNQVKELELEKEEERYKNIYSNYLNQVASNVKLLQDKFLEGKLDIKEYEDSKIDKLKASLLLKEDESGDQISNFIKLSYSLYEYKKYLEFKELLENIKKIYQDKNNKSLTKSILKDINKCEKKILKANKSSHKKIRIFKANTEKLSNTINTALLELKDHYKNYDDAKFKETVATELDDNSTLLEALKIAAAYKIDFGKLLKLEKEDITQEEIDEKLKDLEEFIMYPNNNIINNVTITEEKDLVMIILDKYKLMNINLTNEQFEDTNIDSLISTVDKILVNHYINDSEISLELLNDACEFKKILDSTNNEEE